MGARVEIITGVERRRRWRVEEKLRIVAEVEQPGACFAEVARGHDVSRGLLWNWRRQVQRGKLASAMNRRFVPVHVLTDRAMPEPERPKKALPGKPSIVGDTMIEIALADGTMVRVGREVGVAALRRVPGVLRG